MDEMERSPRVVIVGAGIAAVAAANLLISEGIEEYFQSAYKISHSVPRSVNAQTVMFSVFA